MSNESYSKGKSILEAVRSILVADNSNTGNEVREIHYYCADRIYRSSINKELTFPAITFEVDDGDASDGIPTGEYFLSVHAVVPYDYNESQDVLDNIISRIEFLLIKKHQNLNLASSKNLRCRYIQKMSALRHDNELDRLYIKTTRFRLICDDELLN